MAKVQFNCRLESDIASWIAKEAERLTKAQGIKYSQADVIARLVIRCDKSHKPEGKLSPLRS